MAMQPVDFNVNNGAGQNVQSLFGVKIFLVFLRLIQYTSSK